MADVNKTDNTSQELNEDTLESVSGGTDNYTSPFQFRCNRCGYLVFTPDDGKYYVNPDGTLVKGMANLNLTGFHCPVCPAGRLEKFEGFDS